VLARETFEAELSRGFKVKDELILCATPAAVSDGIGISFAMVCCAGEFESLR
jgi:hypothetical protein